MTRSSHIPGPTNIELIDILQQRIQKNKRPSFITDMHDLYEKEPWLLQHVSHVGSVENLWFYFVTRKKHPKVKKPDSTRTSRTVAEVGRWKTTGLSNLSHIENEDGVRVGYMKTISFKAQSGTVIDGKTTGWVMHEFVLDKPGFQELALCRIRFYPRKDNAQYAPRLTQIVIGLERGEGSRIAENNSQGMEQRSGSCSGGVVSNLALQHKQDSNYPKLNRGVEQRQHFSVNGRFKWVHQAMEEKQKECDGSSALPLAQKNEYLSQKNGWFLGESSGQQQHNIRGRQATYLSLTEIQQQQQRYNYLWGQETGPSLDGYCALYSSKPYVQRMIDHQVFGQDSNLPLTQPQNKIVGQATHNAQCSAQPYGQYKVQNNELPTVPMKTPQQQQTNELTTVPISVKTRQQQDTFISNPAALEAKDDVPLIDQTMEAQATDPLGDDFFKGIDTEMADWSDDFCVGDLAQQLEKIPIPDNMFY